MRTKDFCNCEHVQLFKDAAEQALNAVGRGNIALAIYLLNGCLKEHQETEEEYKKYKGYYILGKEQMKKMKSDAIVMHPLPRVDEISPEIDSDPKAAYFRQAENGLYIRMALLDILLGDS